MGAPSSSSSCEAFFEAVIEYHADSVTAILPDRHGPRAAAPGWGATGGSSGRKRAPRDQKIEPALALTPENLPGRCKMALSPLFQITCLLVAAAGLAGCVQTLNVGSDGGSGGGTGSTGGAGHCASGEAQSCYDGPEDRKSVG